VENEKCTLCRPKNVTVKNHKEIHRFAILAFEDNIKRLESTIEGYTETYE